METLNTISDIQLLLKRIWAYEKDVFINIVCYIYSIPRRDFIDGKYSLPSILNARLFYSYFPSIRNLPPCLDVQLSDPYVTVIGHRPNHYMMTKARETHIADHILRVTIQAKWIQFHNSIEDINYFRGLPNLSYVNIPDTVKFISEGAFFKCAKLKNVVIGNSVTHIGICAFQGCDIETLYLPDSIYKIGKKAFFDNKNLKFVSIPNKKSLEYCRIYRYSSFPPHTKVIVRGEIEADSDS